MRYPLIPSDITVPHVVQYNSKQLNPKYLNSKFLIPIIWENYAIAHNARRTGM